MLLKGNVPFFPIYSELLETIDLYRKYRSLIQRCNLLSLVTGLRFPLLLIDSTDNHSLACHTTIELCCTQYFNLVIE